MAAKPIKPRPDEVLALLNKSLPAVAPERIARVFETCLREMLILFYPPYRAETEIELLDLAVTGLCAYAEDLAEFDAPTLHEGWRRVRRAHRTERWPTIEAIRSASQDAAASRRGGAEEPERETWRRALIRLIGRAAYAAWGGDHLALVVDGDTATLKAPTPFVADYLRRQWEGALLKAAKAQSAEVRHLRVAVKGHGDEGRAA